MKYSILSLILSICILSCETYDPAKQAVKTNTTTSTTTGTGTTGTGTTDTGTTGTGTTGTGTTGTGTTGTGTTGTGTTGTGTTGTGTTGTGNTGTGTTGTGTTGTGTTGTGTTGTGNTGTGTTGTGTTSTIVGKWNGLEAVHKFEMLNLLNGKYLPLQTEQIPYGFGFLDLKSDGSFTGILPPKDAEDEKVTISGNYTLVGNLLKLSLNEAFEGSKSMYFNYFVQNNQLILKTNIDLIVKGLKEDGYSENDLTAIKLMYKTSDMDITYTK